ncbi:MAG: hypothetical protein QOD83_784 [Solirubrobacteraceae bacterium]|jgi:hypothetical protein|nr:hypothetical protein [Solirubrobacteraceae bacterium]MEA2181159.1 hypothetical protein [Solirubrobacteraceae bacterium]MEA2188910.1 hypothetical protein [Solirubrobacteraceae bacterium]MEA2230968.1 hypothetical protein [Solirubrobacteraceae bacterium]
MTNAAATYLVAAVCGVCALAAYGWFIVIPAWSAYSKTWERIAACFLSLYALVALLLLGAAGGAAIAYYWDRIAA